ncbi:MAG: hypothetical protein GW893_14130 [Armatimonadetes bacterium]|nr:hypothetical protein [Armatimonadota bacterium]
MAQAPGGFPLIQELVRQRKYYWSNHVGQQVDAGEFDETDLEACIRSGVSRRQSAIGWETRLATKSM